MKGHSTFVTHMDFSTDSRVLQSNDAAREILYWDVHKGRQLANSFDLRDTEWHTWSCVFGWSVQGIWEENAGGEQNVLSVARSNNGSVVVTGDDNNMINLFRYPALKGVHSKAFGGHMSPVVSLTFSNDDTKLFSTGGTDCSIFQWKYE
jgi:WD40 repeat protein